MESTSADIGGFNNRNSSINANHMNMTRYPNRMDIGYQRILGHLKTLVNRTQEYGEFFTICLYLMIFVKFTWIKT